MSINLQRPIATHLRIASALYAIHEFLGDQRQKNAAAFLDGDPRNVLSAYTGQLSVFTQVRIELFGTSIS